MGRKTLSKAVTWIVMLGLLWQPFSFGANPAQPVLAAPMTATPEAEPTSISGAPRPALSISRAQSSYSDGTGLRITYTVYNNLPPAQAPEIAPGMALTATLAALDAFDPLSDPNTMRQLVVTYEPTVATFVSSSLPASVDEGVYVFLLDDIPPLGSATFVVELEGPGSVTDVTELDTGATAWGTLYGQAQQAMAPPATLWPAAMGDWLACTLDANCADPYVIEQAARLGQTPAALFEFVRGLDFESYTGSLRGARGALWSEAGNSADQASLLIALLRATGIPARYRSGQLAETQIDTLLASMFPPPSGVVGYLPGESALPLADPVQNDLLREESRTHWWVEAYLPGAGWTDLDPAFAAAEIGDRFVNDPDPVPLSELPAALRHTVNLRLKVEHYHPLTGLTPTYPLDYTFSAVELVGEPVTLGHLVETQNQGGLVFGNLFHTYTPYLMLRDAETLLEGEPFQELVTNFPLGTTIVTGEWLLIDLHHPDGSTERHERTLYDALGYDVRLNGGTIDVGEGGRTDEPFISELTLFTGLFAPSFVPVEAIDREYAPAALAVTEGQAAYDLVNAIMADGEVAPEEIDPLLGAVQAISRLTRASQRVLLLQHAAAADFGTRRLGDAFLVRPYYDTPRVHLMAWETDPVSGQQRVTLDLRRNAIRALPYPGQSLRGWQAFNAAYGLAAMSLESDLLQRLSPDAPVRSVANVLSAAQAQGIPLTFISPANLEALNALPISAEAKARITADLVQNPRHFVIVPDAPVLLGGEETVGWLRGDIVSGEIIDVSEDGLHLVSVEYSILITGSIQEIGFAIAGYGQGFAGFTLVFLGEFLGEIPGDMKATWDAALAAATQWASDTADLIAEMYEHDWVEAFLNGVGIQGGGEAEVEGVDEWSFGEFDWRVGGFNNGAEMAASVIGSVDPPLAPALAARLPEHEAHRAAVGVIATPASSSGTALSASLLLPAFSARGTLNATWEQSSPSGLRFRALNGEGELYAGGTLLGSGPLTALAGDRPAHAAATGTATYQSSGSGGMSFYAPALEGLGSGAHWETTTLTLTPQGSLELELRGADVLLDGQLYSGTLTLVATSPLTLEGEGPLVAPQFVTGANLTTANALLGLAPTSGELTVGGATLSLSEGVALPNFSGTIAVSEADSEIDTVTLSGDTRYFRLATTPSASATTPGQPVSFQATIAANFSDSYTVTVSTPGWAAAVAPDGTLTVTPTLSTPPGEYAVLVTARSGLYPRASVATEHPVTVNATQGVEVNLRPDPVYTIPWGEPADAANPTTNNGQVQLPGAAYTVEIVNRSTQAHTFAVTVSGLAADWLIFAGAEGQTATQVTLPAGGRTWLGLYVRPATPTLPPPGGSTAFTVTAVASGAPAVTDSDSALFVMPSVPFQQLWVEPAPLFTEGGTTAGFTLRLRNVGNAPGSFDLAATLPEGWSLVGLQTPVTVAPGQTDSQPLTLTVPAGPLGSVYPVSLASPVPDQPYTQWATLNVRLVSPNTAPIFAAAVGCLKDEPALAAALHALALAMAELEESCAAGGCAPELQAQVVAAAESAAHYGRLVSPLGETHTGLAAAAAELAAQSDDAGVLAALPGITAAVTALETELCAILDHRPLLRLTPWMDAALPDQPVEYALQLTNRGRLTTTYAVTVTRPGAPLTFQATVPPGATESATIPVSTAALGIYLLEAEATALEAPISYITARAEARLNVVERFIQVTAARTDPPFVETGVSSTTVQVEISNVAGIGQSATVVATLQDPAGAVQWTQSGLALNILGGAPRTYELATVDTSGWEAGVYTLTLDVQLHGAPTEGGSGYGYLSIGQAVIPSHGVTPLVVAPGTVTVTTRITTELNSQLLPSAAPELDSTEPSRRFTIYDAPYWEVEHTEQPAGPSQLAVEGEATVTGPPLPPAPAFETEAAPVDEEAVGLPLTFQPTEPLTTAEGTEAEETEVLILSEPQLSQIAFTGFTRTEQDDPAITYVGSWSNQTTSRASGGSYWRNATAGSTAAFAFEGEWLNVGFVGSRWSGYVELAIDGESQGTFDLYRREDNTPLSLIFDELGAGPHTLTLTVTGSSNPFASGNRVQLDYIDVRDGSPLGVGTFEENNVRILRSAGWVTVTNAAASGGTFGRGGSVTAWFPFDGDSFTYHAMAYNLANRAQLYVDGQYLDTVDLYHPNNLTNAISRTFSYAGFGPGPHLLQINAYRSQTTLDALTTPGAAPFIDPDPPVGGITRFEEDHPEIRYNGVVYPHTAQSWNRVEGINGTRASDGQYLYSAAAGDTISFDFEGPWIGVGFVTDRFGGQAEIAIDGTLMAEADLYTRESDTESFYFDNLGAGTHTLTITVLGTRHPNALNSRVYLDYLDVWDGQPLPEGTFEETDGRIFYSNGWSHFTNAEASEGGFAATGSSDGTAWFPFTGDSVTFQTWTAGGYHSLKLKIDGVSLGHFNTYSYQSGPRAFSFEGLGEGPHVLEVRKYRNSAAMDAFITPATGEHYELPTPTGVIRLEEDHPDLRYDGYPFRTMPGAWSSESTLNNTSGQYNARTGTAGSTLSLEFEGTWVGVGFRSASWSGVAEIFIDDVSRGTVDTANFAGGIMSVYYDDLPAGTHVISVTAVSGTVMPDFIDVWDGQPLADGWYNAALDDYSGRFHYSNKGWWGQYENLYAYEGDLVRQNLINANPNIWLTFTGNDLTLLTRNGNDALLDITIDGVHYGEVNLTADYSNQPYALHFPDLGEGPHVMQIHTRNWGSIDAFEINPDGFYAYTPEIIWHDNTAKESLEGTSGTGFLTTIAIGDLNGDGNVELVAPGRNGRLYVYRGDGQDTGDGTPILWTSDLVGPAAEPALADLTGDGLAEIIVSGRHGTFAFRHDGLLLWENPDVVSYYANEDLGWGGPTVANLDADPEPELVIAASEDALYVLDHTGAIEWSEPIGVWPTVPVLADITGDGRLNIIVAQRWELRVYDYLNGSGELAWTYVQTDTTNQVRPGVFGAPAVADLTGDGRPEIIINWGHIIEALRYDGTSLWRYHTNNTSLYRPSPVTVADVTGDGEVNLITASAISAGFQVFDHLMMVLTADGSLVWEQTVRDNTGSASGVAAQDLTGDGVWEILWNGATDGFLVIRGSDGKRLFNEPFTGSGTIVEYPTMGDVDGDGVADVVVAGREGLFVISHVGRWTDSRPLWNQHNYHVTNINDDWSIPFTQPNSWELHNTYRTQTPERNPAPSYRVELTHTVGLDNVTVLTETFSAPPTGTPPQYRWQYQLEWYAPVYTLTFASELTDVQPGESRQLNQGTEVAYRLPSGWNRLTLPPLYVTGARILELAPESRGAAVGSTATYTLTLRNPSLDDALYTLDVLGLPPDWVDYPTAVNVPAGSDSEVLLTVTALDGEPAERPFAVTATTDGGGQDLATASLLLFDGLTLSLAPPEQTAPTGTPVTYTLTLTNPDPLPRTYTLDAGGLASVALPLEIALPAETAVSLPITVSAETPGPHPFTLTATGDGDSGSVDGVLVATGRYAVGLALDPESAVGGPETFARFDVVVTNLGDVPDGYDLTLDLPPGWSAMLDVNGTAVESLALPPHLFNSAALRLRVKPALGTAPGEYPLGVTATSQARPGVQASITGTVEVLPLGVQISIDPQQSTQSPLEGGLWQVTLTNVGSETDTYDLAAAGIVGLTASFSSDSVTLAPGASTTVQLSSGPFPLALPQTYPFWVTARSQSDARIAAEAKAEITFTGYEDVKVAWLPAGQTVTGTLTAHFRIAITNTGNLPTTYQLALELPGLRARAPVETVTLPARATAVLPVRLLAPGPGTYPLSVTAQSGEAADSATTTLTIAVLPDPEPGHLIYLPFVSRE